MVNDSIVKNTALESPLLAASTLNPQRGGKAKNLVAGVLLTSLIDAFSILVIYLLMNFSNSGETLLVSKEMQLPSASEIKDLKRTTLVKLDKERILVEGQEVTANSLLPVLIEKRKELAKKGGLAPGKEASLTVQADRRTLYKELSKIIQAGNHAGFGEIKFAVLFK